MMEEKYTIYKKQQQQWSEIYLGGTERQSAVNVSDDGLVDKGDVA